MTDKITQNTKRFTLWGLVLVFFLPLALAVGIYATRTHWPLQSATAGELIEPPLTLPLNFVDNPRLWRILLIRPDCNDATCELQLAKIESIHEATGKDFNRTGSTLITTTHHVNPRLLENFKNVHWFELHSITPIDTGLFIMDPQGYIILKYPLDAPGADILEDLRHLLRISRSG
jgi:hypothetical protein